MLGAWLLSLWSVVLGPGGDETGCRRGRDAVTVPGRSPTAAQGEEGQGQVRQRVPWIKARVETVLKGHRPESPASSGFHQSKEALPGTSLQVCAAIPALGIMGSPLGSAGPTWVVTPALPSPLRI